MGKRLLYIVSILLGVAGFCTIPFIVGVHDLLRTMRQGGWPAIVLCVSLHLSPYVTTCPSGGQ